jgi:hypothetical protein
MSTSTSHAGLASPLHWPTTTPRTPAGRRRRNPLWKGATVSTASVQIEDEVRRLDGSDLVLSTNLALRIDGFPRSGQPEPSDPGVAVYFKRKGKPLVFACDRYATVRENLRAVGMHLAAMRGIERWGCGTLDQAFAGYMALPEHAGGEPWWRTLGLDCEPIDVEHLTAAYRDAAKRAHPDVGGSADAFKRVREAFEQGLAALGGAQ